MARELQSKTVRAYAHYECTADDGMGRLHPSRRRWDKNFVWTSSCATPADTPNV